MADYQSMANAIRSVLIKPDETATLVPNVPDSEAITEPDPVDVAQTEEMPVHPRMEPQPRTHHGHKDLVKHHLVRNIRAQQKIKVIDAD